MRWPRRVHAAASQHVSGGAPPPRLARERVDVAAGLESLHQRAGFETEHRRGGTVFLDLRVHAAHVRAEVVHQ